MTELKSQVKTVEDEPGSLLLACPLTRRVCVDWTLRDSCGIIVSCKHKTPLRVAALQKQLTTLRTERFCLRSVVDCRCDACN